MIDPMAGVDAGSAAQGAGGPPGDVTGGEGTNAFDVVSAQLNAKKTDEIRSFMGIVSGCVAGVLGLTGSRGFVCFAALQIVVSASILAKMRFDLKSYSQQSLIGFLTTDLQKSGLSFVLFWTLFYGLVYLF